MRSPCLATEPRSFSLCFTPESLRYGTRRSQREFRSRFSERTAFLFNENIKGRIKDKYNEITNSFPWSSTLFKKKTHPVCDAKKCKCAVAPFFFFLERAYFMDITQQKSTTYQRPAWYGVYDLKKKCFLSMYELTRPPGLRSTSKEI